MQSLGFANHGKTPGNITRLSHHISGIASIYAGRFIASFKQELRNSNSLKSMDNKNVEKTNNWISVKNLPFLSNPLETCRKLLCTSRRGNIT